jgi:predicted glutamine amidotransferase
MCRILAVRSVRPVAPGPFLRAFALRCRGSKEYQGDGWGVAWREGGAWRTWRTVEPVWSKEPPDVPATTLFLAHARSAFRNEGVVVANNMPFVDGSLAFAFNGELRGVRLRAPGETGAWRLLHLLRRFTDAAAGDVGAALRRLDAVVMARAEYVRALNVVASDGDRVWVNSRWGEDPDYFTLWRASLGPPAGRVSVVASEPLDLPSGTTRSWEPVPNGVTEELAGLAATPDGATRAAAP